MTDTSNTTIFELADQFIALANQLSQQEGDVGKVGTALRFAAARFNAFEAAIKSADLGAEKDNALDWFSAEYREMLSDNLDDHIANPPVMQEEAVAVDDSVQIFKG
ncbi:MULTISPECIES: DUF3144 domain-containing protein [Shewanella]|uniref:DUF3144 domain-containing protein n=1 Tax=Shewanella TaxID=22 RepID=UPI000B347BFD|nr:DUF3144 domain-containing protein [Shewanella mangrovisoli]QXN25887.1 DUF3144 domain-containing protein [Shewanella putrefaciens]QYK08331.1 DUF3144 domain-containing protein [Shewanella mangrovisoli]VEE61166.1 Protein of uncharacterised function (DUF3144) [Shewanella putrefaciens]